MSDPFEPIEAAAMLLAIVAVNWRMQRVVQPLRLKMADCGESLLQSGELTPETRMVVEWMLGTAFGSRKFLIFALFAAPAAVFSVLFGKSTDFLSAGLSDGSRKKLNRLNTLHTAVMFGNHPVLFIIVVVNMAIWSCIAAFGKLIYGGAFPKGGMEPVDFTGLLTSSAEHHGVFKLAGV